MTQMSNNGNAHGFGNWELPSIPSLGPGMTDSVSVSVGKMNYLNLFKKSGGF